MGQKGKFLANRLLYSQFWYDLWYTTEFYQNIFFQVRLIKEFLKYFFLTGILTLPSFNLQLKFKNFIPKITNSYLFYQQKYKKKLIIFNKKYNYIASIKGLYFSKIWVLKLADWVIISIFFYNFNRQKQNKFKKLFRLFFFYKSFFFLLKKKNTLFLK